MTGPPDGVGPVDVADLDASPPTDPEAYDPVSFLVEMVRLPCHEDVTDARDLLVATLAEHGVDAAVDDAGNVLATRTPPGESADADPHVVLNTHLDTVSPDVPFERDRDAVVEDEAGVDVIRGRGACDAKGPLAALVGGFLSADVDRGRLTLAITPDEEVLSLGAAALTGKLSGTADALDGDLFLVGEPTGLDVCTAAKGRFEGTVELAGENAHAAEFAGVNAVAAAEDALAAIRTFDADAEAHPQLGPPKLTPTAIEGGGATNQVPDRCAVTVDRRSVPPESVGGFRDELEADVRAAVDDAVGVAVSLTERDSPFLEAFATDPDHRLPRTLRQAVDGTRPAGAAAERGAEARPFSAATEASYFAPAPTVVFGPGDLADGDGAVAHAEREYVRVREVEWATAAVERALSALLGPVEA
ncbi:M20/M25/M40 family metallo-hydrolase [Haloparvum sedimenti]|uniref:M20/M25/M40 family metallo-hydrolase n=1 Tax=Haloparvum sedimenti TaxID=1678448 RepID=UPI0009B5AA2B|nr:M20/M25/M40 family metallo-hydrolase [Haloparvum sedimenti]